MSKAILEYTGKISRKSLSEGSFENRILFCIKYKVLFLFASAASVAVEALDAALPYL